MIPISVLPCPTVQRDGTDKSASVAGHGLPTIVLCMFLFLLVGCHRSTTYYSSRGASFFAKGQYADAEINYRKAIQTNISNGEAHAGLGLTELKQGHPADAYRSLTRAVDLLPGRDDLKVTLGNLVVTGYLDDKDRPKRLYDQLVKLSDSLMAKDPFDALRFKGYLAAFDNDTPRSLELFERANRAKPIIYNGDRVSDPRGLRILMAAGTRVALVGLARFEGAEGNVRASVLERKRSPGLCPPACFLWFNNQHLAGPFVFARRRNAECQVLNAADR